jgi:uncharacterized coiled-coil protein SlyX
MENSGEEDWSNRETDSELIRQLAALISSNRERSRQQDGRSRNTHSTRRMVRQEVGFHRIRGFNLPGPPDGINLPGSSDDILATKNSDRDKQNDQMLELHLIHSKRLERLEEKLDLKQSEIDQLNITIAELTKRLETADTQNRMLLEKVEKLEEREERFRKDFIQAQDDIAGLLKREEKRVFKD